MNFSLECFYCHNLGHKISQCRLRRRLGRPNYVPSLRTRRKKPPTTTPHNCSSLSAANVSVNSVQLEITPTTVGASLVRVLLAVLVSILLVVVTFFY